MNVLYIHNKSEISGGEQSLLNLWDNLDREKFNPVVIIPGDGPFLDEIKKRGLRYHFIEIPKLNLLNIIKIKDKYAKISKIVENEQIVLIHSYTPRNNIVSHFLGKKFKIPVIWHERNLLIHGEKDLSKKFKNLPDAIICNSEAVARRFESNGKIPTHVHALLNGVDLVKFTQQENVTEIKKTFKLKNDTKIVGITGNFTKRKRVDYFIKCAAQIAAQEPNVQFLVIGGEFESDQKGKIQEMKDLATELGIKDKVVFTGFQSDIVPIVSALDIFVHVATEEACSRSILEALALGKPSIVINDGGNPELVEHTKSGFLVGIDDQQELVTRVLYLIRNNDERLKMSKFARQDVEKRFDVRRNAKQTMDLYQELIEIK